MRRGCFRLPFVPLMLAGLAFCAGSVSAETVDVNSADAQTLARVLNGVGSRTAQAIVAYREANGPFTSLEDLVLVRGIGLKLLERNRDRLRLGAEPAQAPASGVPETALTEQQR